MGELPRRTREAGAPGAPLGPELEKVPFPTEEEHLQLDNELQQLLLQLRPAEMLIAFDAALCLLQQVHDAVPLRDPGRAGPLHNLTPRQVQDQKDEVRRTINQVRLRFLPPGDDEQRYTSGGRWNTWILSVYETEMEGLQRAVRAGKPVVKTRAENYMHNHPADTLRGVFPLISTLALGLPRLHETLLESDVLRHQWRAVRWLLTELKRRLAYQRIRKMTLQGPATDRVPRSPEGEGGVSRPVPYAQPTRRIRVDPIAPPCKPSVDVVRYWRRVRLSHTTFAAGVQQFLDQLAAPQAKWLAIDTMLNLVWERLELPEVLHRGRDRLRQLIVAYPAWPPAWPVSNPALRELRAEMMREGWAGDRYSAGAVSAGLGLMLHAPQAHEPIGVEDPPHDPTRAMAMGVERLSRALARQQAELELERYGIELSEIGTDEMQGEYLACWQQRVQDRLGFRDASSAELQGETLAGPRSRRDWHRTYAAQVVHKQSSWGMVRHLKIHRHDGKPITAGWDVLQRIKNDMLGEDVTAIEVFPAEAAVVEEVNYRHLFEVPDPDVLPSLRR